MSNMGRTAATIALGICGAAFPLRQAHGGVSCERRACLAAAAAMGEVEAPGSEGKGAALAWEKPGALKAVSFSLDYTLASDYVWRGLNFSEYRGEGREKLNHQLGVGFEIDPSKLGTANVGRFGGSFWFEWYAGQERLSPWSSDNLQEVDYSVYWAYDFEDIGLGIELGWIAYHFPRLRDSASPLPSDGGYTHEVYVSLSYDDSKLFGRPMLRPTVAYYHDVDDVQAGILAFRLSHDFAFGSMGLDATPILKDLTVTPSLTLVFDHRYYDKAGFGSDAAGGGNIGSRLGFLEYGLTLTYDLSGALCIPPQYGALSVGGFLNYCQSLHDEASVVHDELYGGMTLGWRW